MLVKLMPEQVAEYWEVISPYIEDTLPPINSQNGTMTSILSSILMGTMDCWSIVERHSMDDIEDITIYGYVTTTVQSDECSEHKSLLIYSLFTDKTIPVRMIKDGIQTLLKEAKHKGCHNLSAYTEEESILSFTKRFMKASSMEYITIPIKQNIERGEHDEDL